MKFRIGFGYDVHRLAEHRKLVIGGIDIPHSKGAEGHSDADVLVHAVCDAMLGAANLGDIGKHFPDSKPAYKNIDSKILLKKVLDLITRKGFRLGNIDSTICLEKPKISPYITKMQKVLAEVLETDPENISIKATTTEKMGFIGLGQGISAYAVALLESASISEISEK
jgi:2-C-methyl-D-erythritol 2,4-cyclodiphosphate synthase